MKTLKALIGVLFFIAGIVLFFYPDYREWKNLMLIESIENDFQEMRMYEEKEKSDNDSGRFAPFLSVKGEKEQIEDKEDGYRNEDSEATVLPELYEKLKAYNLRLVTDGQHISDAWSFQQTPVDMKSLNNGSDIIGYLEIPDITLSMPLYIGATESNMARGAVVLSETSMPVGGENTNCVIAGHRGWSGSPYFRDIDKLNTDSIIYITTAWEKMAYKVTGSEIVHETDCSILNIQPGKDMVTLFSCYPYMATGTSYRLAIFCERTDIYLSEEKEVSEPSEESSVAELLEQDLEEKGIIISENPYQKYYDMEDTIRRILPLSLITIVFFIKGIQWILSHKNTPKEMTRKRKKTH